MHLSKSIGSMLILIGTAIGAGMLALPLISAQAGFLWASLLLISIWAVMTYTGLLVLEVNLAFPAQRNSFSSMAYGTLGRTGQIIAWLACIALLYSLTAAYIAGNSSLFSAAFHIFFHKQVPQRLNAFLFTLILGGAVFWSTKTVDHLNRFLITLKSILLLLALILLVPHIQMNLLIQQSHHAKYLWLCAPIFLGAFGYHTVIPSLSNYIGPRPRRLKYIIIIGATIPLIIYLLWLFATLTIVPLKGAYSFTTITQSNGSIGALMTMINHLVRSRWVNVAVNGFSDIAITTSFLGVSLGLFDFLADSFKRLNSRSGRAQTALLTFVPPLVFAFFYPQGFILALSYAAIFVAVLEIILPVFMVWKLRKQTKLQSSYRVSSNKFLLIIICLIGFLLIGIQITSHLGILPH